VLEQQQNFVIRSAYRFLTSGLNVAMLDSDPLFPHPNGYTNQRHTQQHADLLANAVRLVRTEWPTVPIWVISTANGTISAVNLAARYANSQLPLKGLILTSSVTVPNPSPGGEHHEVISLNPGLNSIKVPTLVVWHKGDDCPTSPSTNASTVFTALTNVASPDKAAVVIDKGGWLAMPPCSSLAYHGYNGAEDQVVLAIAKFIAAHP
jgi:pimeloyl-ACP methyl ester carboxylesterase